MYLLRERIFPENYTPITCTYIQRYNNLGLHKLLTALLPWRLRMTNTFCLVLFVAIEWRNEWYSAYQGKVKQINRGFITKDGGTV